MTKRSYFLLPFFLLLFFQLPAQQKVVQLYPGAAPGSENWSWNEAENDNNSWHTKVVYNVSHPTLTVFTPDSLSSTGTAAIICPGGGFYALSINSEGYDVAKWLVKKGITCFVLKYRLVHCLTDDPTAEFMKSLAKPESQEAARAVIPLSIADGRNAIAYVRSHANEYSIDKNKIGIIGFSAGGTVTAASAFDYSPGNKPDFVAPIYPYFPPDMAGKVLADAPPLFLAVATNDGFHLTPHSINLYQQWVSANRSAELHIYSTGNHGFGMRVQHLPSDTWIDRFGDWLRVQGFLELMHPAERTKKYTWWQLDEMKVNNEKRFHSDWPNLARYRKANVDLAKTHSLKPRVVFMGNSITDAWINADSSFFAGKNYIDRGISGQTTPQMLLRMRPDVIDLKPAVVVILAGINDIAQNTGPMTLEETFGNIVSMVQLARASHIRVVLCSVLPAYDLPWHRGLEPAGKVIKLNAMLRAYAGKNHIVYVDYFSKMKDARNGLPAKLSHDGVHPTLEGYKIMEGLVEKGVAEVLKRK